MNVPSQNPVTPDPEKCPICHAPLPQGALAGLCPVCLLAQGVSADTATQPPGPAFEPPPIPELARLFPQLEVMRLLGKGGMGAVYQARQPALDRMVALKILPAQHGKGSGFTERFAREARALARLQHPHIVALHEFGQAGGFHYFIMEYVDGLNLRQLQASARLAPRTALDIVPQICEALQYAHDQGVVHRDIKPENVLVTRDGKVKIADFGIAKIAGTVALATPLTAEGQVMGTPHYMAPEQVERPAEVDHRADIFSLGVVFYEMLTGELPLGKFAPPSRKVQVDVRLDEIVMQALEKEPRRRYQHVSEVSTEIQRLNDPAPRAADEVTIRMPAWTTGVDFRSKAMLCGLPWLHVATGIDPDTGRRRVASGIIAIGNVARGWVALGGLAIGGIAFGGLAVGVIAFGGLGLGLLALGGMAVGLIAAFGGGAVGPIAIGGGGIGYYGFGGGTYAVHGVSALGVDPQAWDFFQPWVGPVLDTGYPAFLALVLVMVSVVNVVPAWLQRHNRAATRSRMYWMQVAVPLLCLVVLAPVMLISRPKLSGVLGRLVSGVVLDSTTGGPVAGAELRALDSSDKSTSLVLTRTAADGRYSALVGATKGILQVTAPGCEPQSASLATNAFSSKNHARISFRMTPAPNASAERWSPTVVSGDKPSPTEVLQAAQKLAEEGRYEDALQRFIWYFNHALEYDGAQSGVRVSFCLSSWAELGRRYPKAREALLEIRDRAQRQFKSGNGYFGLFTEFSAINQYLGDETPTSELFKDLAVRDARLAAQVYPVVQPLLINQREYQLCRSFVPDAQRAFEGIIKSRDRDKAMEERTAGIYSRMRMPTNSIPPMAPPKFADQWFVDHTVQLIEILTATGARLEAENIQSRALKIVTDPRLASAVIDAEKKANRR